MWNWGCHGMAHCGQVIIANGVSAAAAQRLGWETAATVEDAVAMAQGRLGHSATISVIHSPPIAMWDVH
jgi:hypothetical protein